MCYCFDFELNRGERYSQCIEILRYGHCIEDCIACKLVSMRKTIFYIINLFIFKKIKQLGVNLHKA